VPLANPVHRSLSQPLLKVDAKTGKEYGRIVFIRLLKELEIRLS